MREIRELEDQVDNLDQSQVQENLQQINKDLKEMRIENAAMVGKLKNNEWAWYCEDYVGVVIILIFICDFFTQHRK